MYRPEPPRGLLGGRTRMTGPKAVIRLRPPVPVLPDAGFAPPELETPSSAILGASAPWGEGWSPEPVPGRLWRVSDEAPPEAPPESDQEAPEAVERPLADTSAKPRLGRRPEAAATGSGSKGRAADTAKRRPVRLNKGSEAGAKPATPSSPSKQSQSGVESPAALAKKTSGLKARASPSKAEVKDSERVAKPAADLTDVEAPPEDDERVALPGQAESPKASPGAASFWSDSE